MLSLREKVELVVCWSGLVFVRDLQVLYLAIDMPKAESTSDSYNVLVSEYTSELRNWCLHFGRPR